MKTNQTLSRLVLSASVVGMTLFANSTITDANVSKNVTSGIESNRSIPLNKCYGCHGKSFEKSALGKSRVVKDLNSSQIQSALVGYKNGKGGPLKMIMTTQIKNYSDIDLNIISKQISEIKGAEDGNHSNNTTH